MLIKEIHISEVQERSRPFKKRRSTDGIVSNTEARGVHFTLYISTHCRYSAKKLWMYQISTLTPFQIQSTSLKLNLDHAYIREGGSSAAYRNRKHTGNSKNATRSVSVFKQFADLVFYAWPHLYLYWYCTIWTLPPAFFICKYKTLFPKT